MEQTVNNNRRKKWTQVELAERCGVQQSTISQALARKNGFSPELARKVSAALGLSLEEVLFGKEVIDLREIPYPEA